MTKKDSQAAIKLYPAPAVKVFFRWILHPHGIYNAYLPDKQVDIIERSEKIEQIQNGRHLVKVKLQIDTIFDGIGAAS